MSNIPKLSLKPILKPGVGIAITSDQRALIGFSHRGISHYLPQDSSLNSLLKFLKSLDGSHCQIPAKYEELVKILTDHNFIKWVAEQPNELEGTAIESMRQEVIGPELRLFNWGVIADSDQEVQSRPLRRILIYGDNRLALSLLWVLQNTGFTQTTFYPLDKKGRRLNTKHLSAIGIGLTDMGRDLNDHATKSAKNITFSAIQRQSYSADGVELVISTIEPTITHLQEIGRAHV